MKARHFGGKLNCISTIKRSLSDMFMLVEKNEILCRDKYVTEIINILWKIWNSDEIIKLMSQIKDCVNIKKAKWIASYLIRDASPFTSVSFRDLRKKTFWVNLEMLAKKLSSIKSILVAIFNLLFLVNSVNHFFHESTFPVRKISLK